MKKILVLFTFLTFNNFAVYAEEQPPVWDANKIVLESHKLAENVYAFYQKDAEELTKKGVPLATSGGFIVGDKGVLIIDTMMTQRLTNQVLDMISSVTDKPVIYAVNTSYHGDHSYGNHLLPAQTIIIQHAHTSDYVNKHFEKDMEFMVQTFGKGRGIEDAVARTGDILISKETELTLDLGTTKVLIKDFGFAQTGGDLFVWLPQEKILWTGNPIVSAAPSLPWLLDGHLKATLSTLSSLYNFLPSGSKVVPGHGAVTDRTTLKWNIDYLQDVHDGVEKAVGENKTLEETLKALPMDHYKGYGLFDWVHSGLNVPAAYKDLSK